MAGVIEKRRAENPSPKPACVDSSSSLLHEPSIRLAEHGGDRQRPDQPSYCSTFKPAFQSVTYTRPSVVTRISADFAARATLGRGSISFLGAGGSQEAISLGANASLISKTRTPATL